MSIGSSSGTAVQAAALVASPHVVAVLACCGHRSLPWQLAVLPHSMVPGSMPRGIHTYFALDRCCSAIVHLY